MQVQNAQFRSHKSYLAKVDYISQHVHIQEPYIFMGDKWK
jgi:hypothetical protein